MKLHAFAAILWGILLGVGLSACASNAERILAAGFKEAEAEVARIEAQIEPPQGAGFAVDADELYLRLMVTKEGIYLDSTAAFRKLLNEQHEAWAAAVKALDDEHRLLGNEARFRYLFWQLVRSDAMTRTFSKPTLAENAPAKLPFLVQLFAFKGDISPRLIPLNQNRLNGELTAFDRRLAEQYSLLRMLLSGISGKRRAESAQLFVLVDRRSLFSELDFIEDVAARYSEDALFLVAMNPAGVVSKLPLHPSNPYVTHWKADCQFGRTHGVYQRKPQLIIQLQDAKMWLRTDADWLLQLRAGVIPNTSAFQDLLPVLGDNFDLTKGPQTLAETVAAARVFLKEAQPYTTVHYCDNENVSISKAVKDLIEHPGIHFRFEDDTPMSTVISLMAGLKDVSEGWMWLDGGFISFEMQHHSLPDIAATMEGVEAMAGPGSERKANTHCNKKDGQGCGAESSASKQVARP